MNALTLLLWAALTPPSDENHWVLKPKNSILWHETVLDWLSRWTR